MKKTLLAAALLALMLLGAAPYHGLKLTRLTVINKSGLPIEIQLIGSCEDNWYYLRMSDGDRLFPTEQVFTIAPDEYKMQVFYIELWDPVYGYSCAPKSAAIDATRNLRVVVSECDWTPPVPGEPSMVKLGAASRRIPRLRAR